MPSLSLQYDPKRVGIAGFVLFCVILGPTALLVGAVPGLSQWLVVAGAVLLWVTLTREWVRRTADHESTVWGGVSKSQALGGYAKSGGLSVSEQRDALSDDEE